MTTQQAPRITEKQKIVLNMLNEGMELPAIAKRMKITTAGVYGHIRNMRRNGVVMPGESMGTEPELPPAPPEVAAPELPPVAPEVAASNGHIDPAAALRAALEHSTTRTAEITQEVAELNARVEALRVEESSLSSQREKYEAALAALV